MSDTDQKFKERAREILTELETPWADGDMCKIEEQQKMDARDIKYLAQALRSVREEENEACAEVAENNAEEYYNAHQFVSKDVCYRLATAIRARLNHTKRVSGKDVE